VLTLKREADLLKGTWTGLSLKMREEKYKEAGKERVRQVPASLDYPSAQVVFRRKS
jgi:hypothetical protein